MKEYKPSLHPQRIKDKFIWWYEDRGKLSFYVHTSGRCGVLSFEIPASKLIKSLKRIGKIDNR